MSERAGKPRSVLSGDQLAQLLTEIRACRVCCEAPLGAPLAHAPRPVLQVGTTARIAIAGQAPGPRVHASGQPFTDPSGVRLRDWLQMSTDEFYDERQVAILPMGFCFPGLDRSGGDLPPRRECAPLWRSRLLALLPNLELVVLVGSYAQRWHLGSSAASMTTAVRNWRETLAQPSTPRLFPLPHPSWRNNAWLKANSWFTEQVVPDLRCEVRRLLSKETKE